MITKASALIDSIAKSEYVYLFGASNVGRATVEYLKEVYTLDKILAIVDTKKLEKREDIYGIPIVPAAELEKCKDALVIITTKSNYWQEITSLLNSYKVVHIETISDTLTQWMINRSQVLPEEESVIKQDLYWHESHMLKFIPKPCLEYMVLNILDHCNLRCKGCDHFACIAESYFVPYEKIYNDLERLSNILDASYIIKMGVMGGEPLLHPNLLKILIAVRKFFPQVIIRLTTNGLLLMNQDEEFWRVCRENRVTIVNTKYPINLDFNGMEQKALEENVDFMYFEGTGGKVVKKSFKKIINLKGDNNPVESFSKCHISNYGNFLMEGKFYGCPFSSQVIRIFNKKFNQNLTMSKGDYLNLYEIEDKKELFEFAARPRYFCRYCTGLHRELEWERSCCDISEWVE